MVPLKHNGPVLHPVGARNGRAGRNAAVAAPNRAGRDQVRGAQPGAERRKNQMSPTQAGRKGEGEGSCAQQYSSHAGQGCVRVVAVCGLGYLPPPVIGPPNSDVRSTRLGRRVREKQGGGAARAAQRSDGHQRRLAHGLNEHRIPRERQRPRYAPVRAPAYNHFNKRGKDTHIVVGE